MFDQRGQVVWVELEKALRLVGQADAYVTERGVAMQIDDDEGVEIETVRKAGRRAAEWAKDLLGGIKEGLGNG